MTLAAWQGKKEENIGRDKSTTRFELRQLIPYIIIIISVFLT